MYNSFQDGTKSAIEMCAVSNMTGLIPDIPGMHQPSAGIDEMIQILRPVEDGGILKQRGVVEVVSCIRSDGSDVPNPMRWGVYVVITTDSDYLLSCLSDYGVIMDDMGKYGLMYRPYHLVGMEAPISIGKAVIYGESTGAPIMSIGEVVAKVGRETGVMRFVRQLDSQKETSQIQKVIYSSLKITIIFSIGVLIIIVSSSSLLVSIFNDYTI